jgi:hypothetical protein
MGMSLEEIGTEGGELAPAKYKIATVPKPHSAFETYIAMVTPKKWSVLGQGARPNIANQCLRRKPPRSI